MELDDLRPSRRIIRGVHDWEEEARERGRGSKGLARATNRVRDSGRGETNKRAAKPGIDQE